MFLKAHCITARIEFSCVHCPSNWPMPRPQPMGANPLPMGANPQQDTPTTKGRIDRRKRRCLQDSARNQTHGYPGTATANQTNQRPEASPPQRPIANDAAHTARARRWARALASCLVNLSALLATPTIDPRTKWPEAFVPSGICSAKAIKDPAVDQGAPHTRYSLACCAEPHRELLSAPRPNFLCVFVSSVLPPHPGAKPRQV